MKRVKIFGLERTCTNYLHWLIRNNYYDLELLQLYDGGWKHGLPYHLPEDVSTIVCVKNPYAWLISLYEWDQNAQLGGLKFKTFVMSGQPVFKFNTMLSEWFRLLNSVVVRYEDLLKNPEVECDRVAKEVGFQKKQFGFLTPGEQKLDFNTYTAPSLKFNREYYTNQDYLAYYDEEMKEHIRTYIDKGVIGRLGYELL